MSVQARGQGSSRSEPREWILPFSVDDALRVALSGTSARVESFAIIPGSSVCEGCNGWLLEIDSDASISGELDAPIPCSSCGLGAMWSDMQWLMFRARMDRLVAAWTLFYGPPEADLVAERQEWELTQQARQPLHLVG